jgi:hypothetical protein
LDNAKISLPRRAQRQVLEVAPCVPGQRTVHPEADQLGIGHMAAGEPAVQFEGGLRLAGPEGTVHPDQHSSDDSRSIRAEDRADRPRKVS